MDTLRCCGVLIAPEAQLGDGQLDVVVLHDVPVVSLLRRLSRFYRGTHVGLDGVTAARGTHLRARTDTPVWGEADGELLGRLAVTVQVVPEALRVQC